jgi:teichuronic acid exporter
VDVLAFLHFGIVTKALAGSVAPCIFVRLTKAMRAGGRVMLWVLLDGRSALACRRGRIGLRGGEPIGYRRRVGHSAFWLGLDAGGSAAVSMLGTLAAAAIVGPEAVGLSAIALGIVQIALYPIAALFADPICQRKRLASVQLDAAFWLLLALGSAVAAGLFATAGLWARIYGEPTLATMLAVGSLPVLLAACSSVQGALLRRHMRFRALAIIGLATRSVAAVTAVALALAGFGAWSLLLQFVVSQAAFSLACVVASGWRPRFRLPFRSLDGVIGFALTETAAQCAAANRSNLFLAIVALHLPLERVGEIGFAIRITDALRSVIGTAAGRLCLALFSRQQDAAGRLRALYLDASRLIGGLALPAFTVLAVCAPELVRMAFGEQWLGAIPFLQVLSVLSGVCLARLPSPFMLTATARPKVALFMQTAALLATVALLLVFTPTSAETAMVCWAAPLLLTLGAEVFVIRAIFGVSLTSQLVAFAPGLAIAVVLGAGLAGLKVLLAPAGLPLEASLAIEAAAGGLVLALGLGALVRSQMARLAT